MIKSVGEKELLDHMNVAELITLYRRHPGFFSDKIQTWLSELSAKVEVLKVIHPNLCQESSIEDVIIQTETETQPHFTNIH